MRLPLLVGAALIVNGMFVSKRTGGIAAPETDSGSKKLADKTGHEYLPPADTSQIIPTRLSVTDETTKHLKETR